MLQFLQTNSAWEAVEFFGGGSSFRGLTKLAAGQKVWPRIRADGYFTQPLTPEPVVWPVKLTNLVVRLKRTDASSVPLAPGGTGR
jgi:hypothetical protein